MCEARPAKTRISYRSISCAASNIRVDLDRRGHNVRTAAQSTPAYGPFELIDLSVNQNVAPAMAPIGVSRITRLVRRL